MALSSKIIPIVKVTSWSFSRYQDYKTCPLKFKLKHIDKTKEPPNAAMERGASVHTLVEQYITGVQRTLPPELKLFADEMKQLRKLHKAQKLPVVVEDNWAFTATWTETEWNNWNNCWVRIKLDCAYFETPTLLRVVDWKTGKYSEYKNAEYFEQLELYALAALLKYPDIEGLQVAPTLVYLDTGDRFDSDGVYTAEDVPRLKQTWEARVKPMFVDKRFAPKPNSLCKWCHFSAAKTGKCQY